MLKLVTSRILFFGSPVWVAVVLSLILHGCLGILIVSLKKDPSFSKGPAPLEIIDAVLATPQALAASAVAPGITPNILPPRAKKDRSVNLPRKPIPTDRPHLSPELASFLQKEEREESKVPAPAPGETAGDAVEKTGDKVENNDQNILSGSAFSGQQNQANGKSTFLGNKNNGNSSRVGAGTQLTSHTNTIGSSKSLAFLPKVKQEVKIDYPEEARSMGVEGAVKLQILVNENGIVKEAKVLSGPGWGLNEAAQLAMYHFLFSPALDRDGKPQAHRFVYQYLFRLEGH